MIRLKHFINNNPTKTLPLNNDTISVVANWQGDNGIELDFNRQVWRGEDAETIKAFRSQYGSNVGMPYRLEVGNVVLPELYFNLRDFKQIGCNEIDVAVNVKQQKDWFILNARAIQIARMEAEGKFLSSDYVQVPYNINYLPDGMEVLMLSISTFLMAKELQMAIMLTAETINEATTGTAGLSPAQVALSVVNAVIRVAYLIAVVVAIVKLIQAILENLYGVTRYHTGLKMSSIFRVCCEEMNLTFSSTIFNTSPYREMVLVGSKTEKGKFNIAQRTNASPKQQDVGVYNFGEFIETFMDYFNADYKITNGNLRFERWDWWANSSTYIIPDNWTNQDRMLNEKTDNADDFVGGYTLTFSFDIQDQNTYDNFNGTVYDVITKNASTLVGYDNGGGSRNIDLPLARPKRKNELTNFEKVLKTLLQFVDTVTNVMTLGNGTNFAQSIQNRIGNMELSSHFISVPKVIIMNTNFTSLANQQETAKLLWERWHFINSFKEINGKHNQWEIYTVPARFCAKDFEQLTTNNFAKTSSGEDVEVLEVKWICEQDQADITYAINRKYNNNLLQSYIESSNSSVLNTPNT